MASVMIHLAIAKKVKNVVIKSNDDSSAIIEWKEVKKAKKLVHFDVK